MEATKVQATITKTDDDQRLVFGWGNVAVLDGATVIDKQDDWWESLDELEDTAYDYVLHSRDGGDTHLRKGVATMVESFVATPQKLEAIGLAPDALPHGWWVGFKVHDDGVWDGVKKGRYTGFSIGGVGKREPGHNPVGKVTKRFTPVAKGDRTDPLVAALHAAAVVKHLPGGHNQKSHGGTLDPLGSAFDKAFAAALQDGHGMSFTVSGTKVQTMPPSKDSFKQTSGGVRYSLTDTSNKPVVVEFDTKGRFRAATVNGKTQHASQGATLNGKGQPGKEVRGRGGVPDQSELSAMSGKTPAKKKPSKVDAERAKDKAVRADADAGTSLQRYGSLYRDEAGNEVWRITGPDGKVHDEGIAGDSDAAFIAASAAQGGKWDSYKPRTDTRRGQARQAATAAGAKASAKAPLSAKQQELVDGLKAKQSAGEPSRQSGYSKVTQAMADQVLRNKARDTFDSMMSNDDWQGYGYLGERQNALDGSDPESPAQTERVAEVDAALLRYARANGVSDEALFTWANSKNGRLFADTAFGSSEPIDDVMDKAKKWGGLPKGTVTRAGEAAARGDKKGMKAAAPAIKSKGKPDGSGTAEDPVAVGKDLDKAVRLLAEGKHVRLEQPDEVASLLDKLASLANEAKAKGESAPDIDLCKISVPGTNLFCHDSKGIPRAKMPQFKGKAAAGSRAGAKVNDDPDMEADIEEEFTAALKVMGIKVTPKTVKASHLRASQSELVGPKVAGMTKAMEAGKIPDAPIFVTRDGYIVDGHHRWAAKVGVDLQDGKLGDVEMPVNMIDLDIGAALDFANAFAMAMGLIPKGTGAAAEGVKKGRRLDRIAKALGASRQGMPTPNDPLAVALGAAARTPCRGCGD
ncbi:MAG: XkdF-like putative serine protease domain-containing protein [Candidatus Nanopelagicales bacterium]|nr:XkdF-like putative serine protease domain-containing protein [Candidatus Nanopelagicales bacterium]